MSRDRKHLRRCCSVWQTLGFVIFPNKALIRRLHVWQPRARGQRRVTHQVLGVEGNLIPPRGHELVVAGEDAAVHVLVPPRVEEGLEAAEPGNRRAKKPRWPQPVPATRVRMRTEGSGARGAGRPPALLTGCM